MFLKLFLFGFILFMWGIIGAPVEPVGGRPFYTYVIWLSWALILFSVVGSTVMMAARTFAAKNSPEEPTSE